MSKKEILINGANEVDYDFFSLLILVSYNLLNSGG